ARLRHDVRARLRHPAQHLQRPGEVELRQVGENHEADLESWHRGTPGLAADHIASHGWPEAAARLATPSVRRHNRRTERSTAMYLPPRTPRTQIMGRRGAVGANHPLAAQAGLDTLRAGGNAVDAAVAIGLALGVVEPMMSG